MHLTCYFANLEDSLSLSLNHEIIYQENLTENAKKIVCDSHSLTS